MTLLSISPHLTLRVVGSNPKIFFVCSGPTTFQCLHEQILLRDDISQGFEVGCSALITYSKSVRKRMSKTLGNILEKNRLSFDVKLQ